MKMSYVFNDRDALIQQFRTARSAIPEPPKIRPLAFFTLRIDLIHALCCLSAFTHYGFILMSQKNPETESVRDQQQGHDESRNEIGRTKLARREPGVIGLVEGIEEIGCTPETEDPCDDSAGCTGQRYQRKQGEYRRNDVPIRRRMREGRGQVWRHDPGHQKC